MTLVRLALQLLPAVGSILPASNVPPGELVRGLGLQVALGLVVVVLLSTAFGFGVAACYMALAVTQGPPAAAGLVAVGLVVVALVLVCSMMLLSRGQARRRAVARLAAQQAAMAPINQLAGQVAANPLRSLLVAAAAGALAGWVDRKL